MASKPSKSKQHKPAPNAVVFFAYPKLLFIWPLIVAGPLFWLAIWAGADGTGSLEVFAWLYMFLMVIVILTIGVDIERNYAVLWFVIFLALFFAGKWLATNETFKWGIGNIYNWFANMDVQYDRNLGLALSIFLLPPYLVMILWSRVQHKWRITHNEFEQYSWGRADDSLARGAKRVRSTYPDLLELLLCGAGTLIVYSATGRSELRRIHNVPLLFLVRKRLNNLLEQTAVTLESDQAILEAEEAETESEEAEAAEALEGSDDEEDAGYDVADEDEPGSRDEKL
ncbi:hypothetical protein HED60_21305 [Planctomycetales bacterium ZRK34]|nr:hypothetical protein HED60_21305 [Planctomycetales bacterium ZRK34]